MARVAFQNVSEHETGYDLLKLDFRNAFKSISRDVMFASVLREMPELHPLVHMCHRSAASLNFCEFLLQSNDGAPQGDPLGPPLFVASNMYL